MPRKEFTQKTKRLALERSQGLCEASGPYYNRPWDDRCNKVMVKVEYDHFILASEGGENDLDNCRAVCPECHSWKTRRVDTPKAAKAKRIRRELGPEELRKKRKAIPSPANHKWPSRPFASRRKDV